MANIRRQRSGAMRRLRVALGSAAVISVLVGVTGRAPADVADLLGGLPATFKLREKVVARMRVRVPGPDLRESSRSRSRDTLVLEDPDVFRIPAMKPRDIPLSGTWIETAPGVLSMSIDAASLQEVEDVFARRLARLTGVRNWSVAFTFPAWQATITDAGERANGEFRFDLTATKGRFEVEMQSVAKWTGRRVH